MLKAIVVDDSLIMRRNVSTMLTEMGHKVIAEAKNGLEAISCYKKFEPDFVTMDITMPDMDGIEAVKEIKKTYKNAKIIMATSHGQEEMVINAIKAGASGYVLKPIKLENLDKAIEKIFPKYKKTEEINVESEEVKPQDKDDDLKLGDD